MNKRYELVERKFETPNDLKLDYGVLHSVMPRFSLRSYLE
jgi:hypothetical protein